MMKKKRIFQLGMEPQYTAHVMMEWNEGEYPCDIRIRRAKAKGLVVVEIEDMELANKVANATGCHLVSVKEVDA